jgi:hypothetical protein
MFLNYVILRELSSRPKDLNVNGKFFAEFTLSLSKGSE